MNSLNINIKESEYNRTDKIGPKINENGNIF